MNRSRASVSEIGPLGARKGETWRTRFPVAYLLTPGDSSTKAAKSNKLFAKYYSTIQYLAPATMAGGPNLCPSHTPGCYGEKGENCIAGSGLLAKRNDVLVTRTRFFLAEPEAYLERLIAEIEHYRRLAKERGKILALRLNGTSDIPWEKMTGHLHGPDGRDIQFSELFGAFPDVQFFDYSKIVSRVVRDDKPVAIPKNYHLTFSQSETNAADVARVIKYTSTNVAVVVDLKTKIEGRREAEPLDIEELRARYGRRSIVDGDLHDLRFRDPPNSIVALRAKGGLRKAEGAGAHFRHAKALPMLPIASEPAAVAESHPILQSDILSADGVREGKLDAASQAMWLEEFAGLATDTEHRKFARWGKPGSIEIGADTWSVAAPVFGALFVRRDLGFAPLPSKMSNTLSRLLESFFSTPRTLIGALKVSDLARFVGGARKVSPALVWRLWNPINRFVSARPIIVGDSAYIGELIGAALRGATPSEEVRLFQTLARDREGDSEQLGIMGPGWFYLQFPLGSISDSIRRRAAVLKPYMSGGRMTVHRTPPPSEDVAPTEEGP